MSIQNKQISNIQSVRERSNYQAFVKQLALEEARERERKMAPVHALAAENAKLLVQIAETERQLLLTDPDEEGKELLSHCEKITREMLQRYSQAEWQALSKFGFEDACNRTWAYMGVQPPDEEEVKVLVQYMLANKLSPADEFSWSTALHRCIAVGLVRLPEPPVPEPEPVVEVKPALRGREKDFEDRKQYQQELQQELFERIKATPFWGEACQSIADTSHKELGAESQIKLAEIFATGRHGAPSISNIRRAARAYWGDAAVGLTPEEEQEKELESLSSDDMLKKQPELGNPRFNVKGIQLSRSDVRDREN